MTTITIDRGDRTFHIYGLPSGDWFIYCTDKGQAVEDARYIVKVDSKTKLIEEIGEII